MFCVIVPTPLCLCRPCRRGGGAVLWHRAGSLHLQQPLGGVHQTHQAGSASLPPASLPFFVLFFLGQLGTPPPGPRPHSGCTAGQMAHCSARCDLNRGRLRTSLLTRPFSFSQGLQSWEQCAFFLKIKFPEGCSSLVSEGREIIIIIIVTIVVVPKNSAKV